jgi:hypothetical protein
MKKIVVIEKCTDCPHWYNDAHYDSWSGMDTCTILHYALDHADSTIHDDCPLPNAEDEDEKNGKV